MTCSVSCAPEKEKPPAAGNQRLLLAAALPVDPLLDRVRQMSKTYAMAALVPWS